MKPLGYPFHVISLFLYPLETSGFLFPESIERDQCHNIG